MDDGVVISPRWGLNPRPIAYKAIALPLSYGGEVVCDTHTDGKGLGVMSDLTTTVLRRPGLPLGDGSARRHAPMLRQGAIVAGGRTLVGVEDGREDDRLGHVDLFGGDCLC